MIIIINNKDWHDRVTYQNSLGIFSWSLVPDKKVNFSSHIYLLSPLSDQLYLRQYFPIQSKIKDLLKMENIGTNHKEYIYVYASDNLCSQINKLVSKWYRVKKTKEKHAHKLWLDPYRETSKTSLLTSCSWSDDLPNYLWVVVTYYTYAFWFQFHLCICLLFSIRGLIGVITSNYRLVDNDIVKTCNFVRITSISWYILNR